MTVDSSCEREWISQCGSHRDGARDIGKEWGFVRFVTARDFRRGRATQQEYTEPPYGYTPEKYPRLSGSDDVGK